jgi:glutaredoxin
MEDRSMRTLALLVVMFFTGSSFAQESYATAYSEAEQKRRPMLIVLGAKWCEPCKRLKESVIEPMRRDGSLESVSLVYIDVDDDERIAREVIRQTGRSTVPQIVLYHRSDEWKRYNVLERTVDGIRSRIRESLR